MKIFEYALMEISSKDGYKSFFKAFIAVATLYLISLMNISNFALPLESDAHKLKYAVEHELKKEIEFNDLKCNFEMKFYKECKLAIYKNNIAKKSIDALVQFQKLLKLLAYLTGGLSILGFVFHSYDHKVKT